MKKLILLVLPSFILLNANAQKTSAILRGGLNLANVSITESGRIDEAKTLSSFQAGFIADINLSKFVALQPGLLITGKGTKTQDGDPSDANYFKATTNPIYLEVPLNLVFKFGMNDGPNFFAGAGPYLAIGIAGKNKFPDAQEIRLTEEAEFLVNDVVRRANNFFSTKWKEYQTAVETAQIKLFKEIKVIE